MLSGTMAPVESREGVRYPGPGVRSYKLPSRCLELNPDPLQKHPVLLTAESLPSALKLAFLIIKSSFLDECEIALDDQEEHLGTFTHD